MAKREKSKEKQELERVRAESEVLTSMVISLQDALDASKEKQTRLAERVGELIVSNNQLLARARHAEAELVRVKAELDQAKSQPRGATGLEELLLSLASGKANIRVIPIT